MSKVSIKGLDKAEVLLALYNGANAQGEEYKGMSQMAVLAAMRPKATIEEAQEVISKQGLGNLYFDYAELGRKGPVNFKLDLTGDEFDSTRYNHSHGEGRAEFLIASLSNSAGMSAEPPSLLALLSMFDAMKKDGDTKSGPSFQF